MIKFQFWQAYVWNFCVDTFKYEADFVDSLFKDLFQLFQILNWII